MQQLIYLYSTSKTSQILIEYYDWFRTRGKQVIIVWFGKSNTLVSSLRFQLLIVLMVFCH